MTRATAKRDTVGDLLKGEQPWAVYPCHILSSDKRHIANVHYKDAIVGVLKYANSEKWKIVLIRQGRDSHEDGRGVYVKPEGKDAEAGDLATVSGVCVRYFNNAPKASQ